jgi:hypothetical protein
VIAEIPTTVGAANRATRLTVSLTRWLTAAVLNAILMIVGAFVAGWLGVLCARQALGS